LTYDKGQGTYETRVLGDVAMVDLDHELLSGYAEAVGAAEELHLVAARG
jgi:hypothetical protein